MRNLFRVLGRWTLRGMKAALALSIVLALVGAIYQYFATKADFEKYHPPGRIVTVEGLQFHIYCTGEGRLTILLEGGAGASSLAWAWIQPELAKSSRVCSYDRAGYAWSSPTDLPMDAINTSQQLYKLLRNANIPGPYLLVGHSIGGAYARMFAANYPKEVAGLILVDATSPSVLETYAEIDLPKVEDWTPPAARVLPYLASVGVMRAVVGLGLFNIATGLPPEEEAIAKAWISRPDYLDTVVREYSYLPDTLKQIYPLKSLNDLPLKVIVAGQFVGLDAETASKFAEWHLRQQRTWLELSRNSSFQVMTEANHISLMTNKLHAHKVADSIIEMVEVIGNRKDDRLSYQ